MNEDFVQLFGEKGIALRKKKEDLSPTFCGRKTKKGKGGNRGSGGDFASSSIFEKEMQPQQGVREKKGRKWNARI